MMHMKRQISTATSDFRQLIEAGYLYVDKTRYVHQIVRESLQNYFFISRPRRYGKSLFCSTLEHLFKGERELFKNMIKKLARENGVNVKDSTPTYMLQEFLDKSEKQSVIIIDEFDSPIIDSLNDKGKLERIRSEFSSFYSVMLGDEEHREQGALLIHNRGDEALEHVDILEDEQPHRRIHES